VLCVCTIFLLSVRLSRSSGWMFCGRYDLVVITFFACSIVFVVFGLFSLVVFGMLVLVGTVGCVVFVAVRGSVII